uniref:Uncharacterized protein n=1 Tax=Arion vulgaris TaxID=1028688 RepID=A0A0B7AB16_9EUPU
MMGFSNKNIFLYKYCLKCGWFMYAKWKTAFRYLAQRAGFWQQKNCRMTLPSYKDACKHDLKALDMNTLNWGQSTRLRTCTAKLNHLEDTKHAMRKHKLTLFYCLYRMMLTECHHHAQNILNLQLKYN